MLQIRPPAARFKNVELADDIGLDISRGVDERIAHARLGSQMKHRAHVASLTDGMLQRIAIANIRQHEFETVMLLQPREPRLLSATS